MSTFEKLPEDLWSIIGDFLFCDVSETEDGEVELLLRPARYYHLQFDADNEIYMNECSLT